MNRTDTFCVLPFVAMHVSAPGSLRPCCMFDYESITHDFSQYPDWRDQGLQDLKHNLTSGVRDPRCRVCWQHEDSGAPSHRQRHNELFHRDLQRILKDPALAHELKMLHLDFDNLCNLKCIMCTPMFSSSLQTEIWANRTQWEPWQSYNPRPSTPWHEHPLFNQLIAQMSTVEEIFITGGEPLMNPGTLRMLEQVDLANKTLTVTTNGTQVNDKVMELLSRAGQLHVMISLEGIGPQNDYVRSGSDWHQIKDNIARLRTLKNFKYEDVGVNHTLQITSAWTLVPLVRWCLDQGIGMTINPLINPKQLHPSGMLDSWRERLIQGLGELTPLAQSNKSLPWIQSTIHYLRSVEHDPAITERFYSFVSMLDTIRGTNFNEIFPPLPKD